MRILKKNQEGGGGSLCNHGIILFLPADSTAAAYLYGALRRSIADILLSPSFDFYFILSVVFLGEGR